MMFVRVRSTTSRKPWLGSSYAASLSFPTFEMSSSPETAITHTSSRYPISTSASVPRSPAFIQPRSRGSDAALSHPHGRPALVVLDVHVVHQPLHQAQAAASGAARRAPAPAVGHLDRYRAISARAHEREGGAASRSIRMDDRIRARLVGCNRDREAIVCVGAAILEPVLEPVADERQRLGLCRNGHIEPRRLLEPSHGE